MKLISVLFLVLFSASALGQVNTRVAYYDNGQVRVISPKTKDGKPHGRSKMWYESGQLWMKGKWKNGEQVKSKTYYESGKRSYRLKRKKWRLKLKMWHPNGQVWTNSKSKYAQSIDKEFDSSGFLVRQTIETKGSSMICMETLDSAASDSAKYEDGSCVCSWGKVYWRNGVWIDEKGRDLNSNYTYVSTEYYTDGSVWKEMIWNRELKKFLVKEWDEKGALISETTL